MTDDQDADPYSPTYGLLRMPGDGLDRPVLLPGRPALAPVLPPLSPWKDTP